MALEMKYFVLKPKAKDQQDPFARASQRAMMAYSKAIRKVDRLLADQIEAWAEREQARQAVLNTSWKDSR